MLSKLRFFRSSSFSPSAQIYSWNIKFSYRASPTLNHHIIPILVTRSIKKVEASDRLFMVTLHLILSMCRMLHLNMFFGSALTPNALIASFGECSDESEPGWSTRTCIFTLLCHETMARPFTVSTEREAVIWF